MKWTCLPGEDKGETREKRERDRVLCCSITLKPMGIVLSHAYADVNMHRKKKRKGKWLTRFLFMRNASRAGVNSVCHSLEGKAIDAALTICCLIMTDCNAV